MTPSQGPLFRFEHVGVAGDGRQRLVDVDASVPRRGLTAIVGPSGSGKSTMLRLCNRLEVPDMGCVLFQGDDVAALEPRRLRRRVGMVFQRPTPFPGTVHENLRVAAPGLDAEGAAAALARVGLEPELLGRLAHDLSGGEAQRMCLARTLVTNPDVVLMDEPTSSVDPLARRELERMARDLVHSGVAILWVTHDLSQLRRVADHALVLVEGRLAHAGPAADLESGAPDAVLRFLAEEGST